MTIITNAGKKLITHAIINKLDLFISKIIYADCNLDMLDENTTTLTNIKYENLPTSVRIDEFDNSKIIFETVLRNDTAQDFFINCVGFVAKNGELLCFTKIKRTPILSRATDTNASLFHYKLAIELKNAKDLSIKIDETIVYPTLAHFNASQKAQDEKIDKLVLDKVNTSDFTASQNLQDEKIKTLETDKADKLNVFTRDEINTKLNSKADKTQLTSYYTKLENNNLLNAKVNITDFTAIKNAINIHLSQKLFLQNGYTKLPNGLILQWGRLKAMTPAQKINFNIAFNQVFMCISSVARPSGLNHYSMSDVYNLTNTSFMIRAGEYSPTDFLHIVNGDEYCYFAVGI